MNQDAWIKSVDTGDFEGLMHWTNDGATPYDMYRDVMDGTRYKPTGQGGINGNYGRYKNDEATQALATYANAEDDASRTAAMATLQKIMIEQQPMLPTPAASTARRSGPAGRTTPTRTPRRSRRCATRSTSSCT